MLWLSTKNSGHPPCDCPIRQSESALFRMGEQKSLTCKTTSGYKLFEYYHYLWYSNCKCNQIFLSWHYWCTLEQELSLIGQPHMSLLKNANGGSGGNIWGLALIEKDVYNWKLDFKLKYLKYLDLIISN